MQKNNLPVLKSTSPEGLDAHLKELFQHIYTLYPVEIDMSLGRVLRFLDKLGNPHLKLPPAIHVAGTNGKGSTIATLYALLKGMNKSVHVMTSPHLVHPTERIILANNQISTADFIKVLEECLNINQDEPITFFEIFTAASFLAMSRVKADYALIETGMGGRRDATNVIPRPACTIITSIAKDHQEFLGDTLEKIAAEKAGIMKADTPCIIGKLSDEAITGNVSKVFQNTSYNLSQESTLLQFGSDWNIELVRDALSFRFKDQSYLVKPTPLQGPHQIYNYGAALVALHVIMGKDFDTELLAPNNTNSPVEHIHWPGRLDHIKEGKLLSYLKNKNQELWIDGGHNESAGQAIAQQMKKWRIEDNKKLYVVLAMMRRKEPIAFVKPMLPHINGLTVTTIKEEQESFSTKGLREILFPEFPNIKIASTPDIAIEEIAANDPNCRILVTGSLYLMGTILS